ncbi:MAG: CDP-glycerol:glycerophosphate glycerophosphotransferase [Lachnospiraceae bacterium]|nr:CDP-glycerol:glycerophosphate glycerophosphotransferase [Lachnospiraceae bacterium]
MDRKYNYKVSVIVPVYNVETYLRDCLDSLIEQTIDKNQMEVILVNDGSTDRSYEICKEYAAEYSFFKLYSKENEGLSATRNYGIRRATGKYMMFIDSDDMYTPETVKEVTDFFDKVYNQTDLVTFLDQPYKNGKKMPVHFRYKYFTESKVYDLNEYPYVLQTRVSVCVKNEFEENVLFDETPNFRQEDQEYNNRVVSRKMTIGYCTKGEYMYLRNDTSIVAFYMYPMYIFETSMRYFETLFGNYSKEVPKYYQAMYIHDLSWKLTSNILFPFHYDGEEYDRAVERIKNLLDRVDDDVILNNPSTDNFHRHFFMNMKHDASFCTVYTNAESVRVYKKEKCVLEEKKFEMILNRLRVEEDQLNIVAFVKSKLFNYAEQPKIYAEIEYNGGTIEYEKQELYLSSFSYYKTKVQTNSFYGFDFKKQLKNVKRIYFWLEVDGQKFNTYYYFMPSSPYSNDLKQYRAIYDRYVIDFRHNNFMVSGHDFDKYLELRCEKTNSLIDNTEVYRTRKKADLLCGKTIWLYYDCRGVEKDNGYYQFMHDIQIDDGIERYYISANPDEMNDALFPAEIRDKVVAFGSNRHKALYVSASKIITAYVEERNISPFEPKERVYYADILKAEIIYLQHGILHAHLPWKYALGRIECDRIVTSSYFECQNFSENLGFGNDRLIKSGMPRFNMMDRNAKPLNRILFAPSWRNYLMGATVDNTWQLTESKFINSDYFRKTNEFLNSEELEKLLENNDLFLDFKIHPIFKPYLHMYEHKNARVIFAEDSVRDEDYCLFITDFSSFVFDFAYLKRTILYFVPDYMEFKSGMNQYRELDLPFEKAFGRMVMEADDAIDEIKKAIATHMLPEDIYLDRMEKFFLPMDNSMDKIYQALSI